MENGECALAIAIRRGLRHISPAHCGGPARALKAVVERLLECRLRFGIRACVGSPLGGRTSEVHGGDERAEDRSEKKNASDSADLPAKSPLRGFGRRDRDRRHRRRRRRFRSRYMFIGAATVVAEAGAVRVRSSALAGPGHRSPIGRIIARLHTFVMFLTDITPILPMVNTDSSQRGSDDQGSVAKRTGCEPSRSATS